MGPKCIDLDTLLLQSTLLPFSTPSPRGRGSRRPPLPPLLPKGGGRVVKTGFNNQWRISIWKESMPQLAEIVGPYIIPEMAYKLEPRRGPPTRAPSLRGD